MAVGPASGRRRPARRGSTAAVPLFAVRARRAGAPASRAYAHQPRARPPTESTPSDAWANLRRNRRSIRSCPLRELRGRARILHRAERPGGPLAFGRAQSRCARRAGRVSRLRSSMALLGICVVALVIGALRLLTERTPLPVGSSYSAQP